jgi:Autotransporter beta-domain
MGPGSKVQSSFGGFAVTDRLPRVQNLSEDLQDVGLLHAKRMDVAIGSGIAENLDRKQRRQHAGATRRLLVARVESATKIVNLPIAASRAAPRRVQRQRLFGTRRRRLSLPRACDRGVGIKPYAAGKFTTFDLPAYAESVVSGAANIALAYSARSVTDSRSELGVRSDKSFAILNGVLTLRGRFDWAHDFEPNRAIAATFQALPGASFVVNGAAQARDSALTTASAEMKWLNGWSAAGTFEGEFLERHAELRRQGRREVSLVS